MEIVYLTPDIARFEETEGHLLSVRVREERHPVVYLHCSFPHTSKDDYISVRTIDNQEVGMIRTLADFPEPVQELLRRHIRLRYFTPAITRILDVKDEFGYSYWNVETTAGHCQFTVGRGNNIRFVTGQKLLISDVDGNRFVIEDVGKLSDKEYRMIETYL